MRFALLVFVLAFCFANEGPKYIDMKERFEVKGKKEAVIFPHHHHQDLLDCDDCHSGDDYKIYFQKKTGTKNDFHKKFCWPCHSERGMKGGKRCKFCHKKESFAIDNTRSAQLSHPSPERSVQKLDEDFYPYQPSLLKYEKSGAEFTEPESCADCHEDKFEEWTGSVHALAFKDPIYQGELSAAIQAVGPDIAKQCEGCHTAAAFVTGEIHGAGISGLSELAIAGVSCDVCHSVSGHTHWQTPYHQAENGSLILSPGFDGPEGSELHKFGPFTGDDDCGMGFHNCIESPLHRSSELCAGCHQVMHYETHTPLEATYMEWKNGPYAAHGVQCQDCHMVDIETFRQVADALQSPKRGEYHHYFNGANFLLYYLNQLAAEKAGDSQLAANAKSKYDMAVARLQSAAELDILPIYRNGNLVEVKITVNNVRAGHNLPTSLTTIRQMWLELTARDENGKIVMQTGSLDSDGVLNEHTRIFNSGGQNERFHFALDPWEISSFASHETIPPKGSKSVYFGITAENPISIEARLRYRQADQKVAEKLLGLAPKDLHLEAVYGIKEIPKLPIIDMAIKTLQVEAKQ